MGPDYSIETSSGAHRIAGVDEAGRGPWAGPVTAVAVILDPEKIPDGLNDSKKLSEKKRDYLYHKIFEVAEVGIGRASVEEIDEINILKASLLAMRRAVQALPNLAEAALIDGRHIPDGLNLPAHPVIGGDGKSVSIAAASIIAKVTRDREMRALDEAFPGYGWSRNKGYGTEEHRVSLLRNGVTPHHRRSFRPIHNILYQQNFLTC